MPGVRVLDAAAVAQASRADDYADLQTVVRVLVPGSDGDRRLDHRDPGRAAASRSRSGRRVAGGVVTDFPVTGLVDGTYTIRVSAKRPIVTGVRTAVVGDVSGSTTPDDSTSTGSTTGSGTGRSAAVGTDAGLVGGDGPVDTSGSRASSSTAGRLRRPRPRAGIDFAWFAAAPSSPPPPPSRS